MPETFSSQGASLYETRCRLPTTHQSTLSLLDRNRQASIKQLALRTGYKYQQQATTTKPNETFAHAQTTQATCLHRSSYLLIGHMSSTPCLSIVSTAMNASANINVGPDMSACLAQQSLLANHIPRTHPNPTSAQCQPVKHNHYPYLPRNHAHTLSLEDTSTKYHYFP